MTRLFLHHCYSAMRKKLHLHAVLVDPRSHNDSIRMTTVTGPLALHARYVPQTRNKPTQIGHDLVKTPIAPERSQPNPSHEIPPSRVATYSWQRAASIRCMICHCHSPFPRTSNRMLMPMPGSASAWRMTRRNGHVHASLYLRTNATYRPLCRPNGRWMPADNGTLFNSHVASPPTWHLVWVRSLTMTAVCSRPSTSDFLQQHAMHNVVLIRQ